MAAPIFQWMGGKRRLADRIISLFPAHKTYVEVFFGGGAVYFAKPRSHAEVINDINRDIVTLFRVVQNHPDELLRQFNTLLVSRDEFNRLKAVNPDTLTDCQRAARFFYLQNLAFGAKCTGQNFGVDAGSPARIDFGNLYVLFEQARNRMLKTTIECLDWHELMTRYDRPDALFYADPPYWQTAGYGVGFPWCEYEKMAAMAKSMTGKLIISINDHPDIRAVFADLHIHEVKHTWTVGGGKNCEEVTELVITNFAATETGLFA